MGYPVFSELHLWGYGNKGREHETFKDQHKLGERGNPQKVGGFGATSFLGLGPRSLPAHLDIDDRDGQLGLGEMTGHPVHCLGHVLQHQI